MIARRSAGCPRKVAGRTRKAAIKIITQIICFFIFFTTNVRRAAYVSSGHCDEKAPVAAYFDEEAPPGAKRAL